MIRRFAAATRALVMMMTLAVVATLIGGVMAIYKSRDDAAQAAGLAPAQAAACYQEGLATGRVMEELKFLKMTGASTSAPNAKKIAGYLAAEPSVECGGTGKPDQNRRDNTRDK